jgi:hypothetical protein
MNIPADHILCSQCSLVCPQFNLLDFLYFAIAEQRWCDLETKPEKFRSRLKSDDSEIILDEAAGM